MSEADKFQIYGIPEAFECTSDALFGAQREIMKELQSIDALIGVYVSCKASVNLLTTIQIDQMAKNPDKAPGLELKRSPANI